MLEASTYAAHHRPTTPPGQTWTREGLLSEGFSLRVKVGPRQGNGSMAGAPQGVEPGRTGSLAPARPRSMSPLCAAVLEAFEATIRRPISAGIVTTLLDLPI